MSAVEAELAPVPAPAAVSHPFNGAALAPTPAPGPKPTVKMEGYLEKKGKMRVVSMWKRYWFVLEGRLLLYYKSQQEYARLSPCRGSLNMGLASCVRPGPGPDRDDGHVLEVVLRSHVVTLRARDRVCQEQWLKALLDSMALPSVTSPAKDTKGPLHFRYPSADNLNTPDQGRSPGSSARSRSRGEKHSTLPNWRRSAVNTATATTQSPSLAPGDEVDATPAQEEQLHEMVAPRKPDGVSRLRQNSLAERRGSVLPAVLSSVIYPEPEPTPCRFHHKDTKKQLSFSSMDSSVLFTPPRAKARCSCKSKTRMSFREEEKENVGEGHVSLGGSYPYRPDENQNRLFSAERQCDFHGGVGGDLIQQSGVDLSSQSLEKRPCSLTDSKPSVGPKRSTSADELRACASAPSERAERGEEMMDVDCISGMEIRSSFRGRPIDLQSVPKSGSLRKRFPHGDGEYVKYSEPEDCDKRDSTFNTTASSVIGEKQCKAKIRLRKRKGSNTKESYSCNLTDCSSGSAEKKRAPLRNRLSFLSRVLSHVRRSRPDDLIYHPTSDDYVTDDAFLSPHPDMHTRINTSPVAHLLTEVKKMDNGLEASVAADFKLGPADVFPREAPEEPPPDYDSVHMESIADDLVIPHEEPPQLPPRHTKRPRSPWHDVPTNNSPVVEMDSEARQRLLSAAKYGKVIGTRGPHNMEMYDWGGTTADDMMQHHAYEVLSDNSPVGSDEHLAIYLSSESSDEEFHEEIVLRRNLKENEFLFGSEGNQQTNGSGFMGPLTIRTEDLPTLDNSGRVGLSHVEAVKLSLLIQAQKTSADTKTIKETEVDNHIHINYTNSAKKNILLEPSSVSGDECVRDPPAEFADSEISRVKNAEKGAEIELNVPIIRGQVLCQGSTEKICEKTPETRKEELESPLFPAMSLNASLYSSERNAVEISKTTLDSPPQLPVKFKNSKVEAEVLRSSKRHSDELSVLLAQLANMTTAPLLPIGGTCSLQVDMTCPSNDPSRKQSLSLDPIVNDVEVEPDYDVPRPHTSLLQFLSNEPHNSLFNNNLDNCLVDGASSLSGQNSPRGLCSADDQSWSGHMSPDSLDFPLTASRPLARDTTPCDESAFFLPKKNREKKDRSRRATLNGPLSQPSLACKQNFQAPSVVRRNSAELTLLGFADVWIRDVKNNVERSIPKQMSLSTSCEHNSGVAHPQISKNSPYVADMCKKFELSTSLEDISERSELERSESLALAIKLDENRLQSKNILKGDEVDMDSLETSELKRLEILEPVASGLISILEESDVHSDRSEGSTDTFPDPKMSKESSESTSEGALICEGDSESKATDQQTSHSTDTDMDMSEDEGNEKMEDVISNLIEPDSLLHNSTVAVKYVPESKTTDFTKDTSLEADSLELKK